MNKSGGLDTLARECPIFPEDAGAMHLLSISQQMHVKWECRDRILANHLPQHFLYFFPL